jgi:predicted RND superfamily exporter protein
VKDRLAGWLFRHRRILTAGLLGGALLLAPRANITRIDNDLTAWFSTSDPVYQEYERFRDEFGGTRNLIVALVAPSRDRLLTREAFDAIAEMTQAIEELDVVDRVVSLSTATAVRIERAGPDEETVDVRRLFADLDSRTPAAIGQQAIEDELLAGRVISRDGTTAALVVFFDESRVDDVRARVLQDIRDVVQARAPAGFEAHFNGSLEISEEYNRVTLANQTTFTPPILLITMAAIYLMFRSWQRTLVTMFAVVVSLIWTLGLYDLIGFNYNVLSSMIVPLVVVLAIADDVHIVQRYDEVRRQGTAEEAFKSTVSHLAAPLLGASGTTALGMLSLATSSVVAVREFGLGSAIGVMVDFVISLVLMPTLLGWLRPARAVPPQETWFKRPLVHVADFAMRHARRVALAIALVAVVAVIGLLQLRVDTNHINFFSPSHPLSRSADVIDTKLGGIYSFQVLVEGDVDSLRTADSLRRMETLGVEIARLPFVRSVTGLPDYVKRIHRELSPGRRSDLPDADDVIAQELLLFSLADEGRRELSRLAASDYSRAQITVTLASMSSDLVFQQIEKVDELAADAFRGSGVKATVTGSGRLFSTLDHYLVTSQISSFVTAFLAVFGVIFIVFRSWRFGLLAIVPNLLPVLTIFGVMGWLGISLNVATIMLASVALGIVDDDTIHFISRYRHETSHGQSTEAAVRTAMAHEARASLTTAFINSCAFAVLALSSYKPTAWFGGLLALTMVAAFVAEIFVLPATITLVPRLFGARHVHGGREGRS